MCHGHDLAYKLSIKLTKKVHERIVLELLYSSFLTYFRESYHGFGWIQYTLNFVLDLLYFTKLWLLAEHMIFLC